MRWMEKNIHWRRCNDDNYNGYSGVVWNMVCIRVLRGRKGFKGIKMIECMLVLMMLLIMGMINLVLLIRIDGNNSFNENK